MKKKCMILLIIFIMLFSSKVKGSSYTLSISHEDNYFYSIYGNGFFMSNKFPYYYIDGEVAYCIEPGKQITTWGYLEDANLPFSEEIIKKLELISRYGYLYPGHNTNLYHMATQMLMWYLTTDKTVELRDQQYGYGNLINIENEKNEIMRLVNNHYTKPSFDNNSYDILYDNELVIKDNSNVLDMYIVKDNDGNEVNIIGNELHINSKKIGKSKIVLEKKKYDNKTTMIFKGDDNYSQKQAILRNNDLIESIININTYGARIKVNKIDSETKQVIKKKGIKFKIKNNDNNEYLCENSECIFETNNEGYFILDKYLLGNYSIYEVEDQELENYLWNKNKLDISITKDTVVNSDNIYSVNFANERVKGNFLLKVVSKSVPPALTVVFNVILITLFKDQFNIDANLTSTLIVIMTATTGFIFLFRLCKPFNLLRSVMVTTLIALFIYSLIFLYDFFDLSQITFKTILLYIVFLICSVHVYDRLNKFMRYLVGRVSKESVC